MEFLSFLAMKLQFFSLSLRFDKLLGDDNKIFACVIFRNICATSGNRSLENEHDEVFLVGLQTYQEVRGVLLPESNVCM